jgi:hypothetical protein
MRRAAWSVMLVMIATLASCERERAIEEAMDAHLTLNVETPEALEWGGTGILRVTVANESEAVAEGGIVEVHVPSWLEFGTVEPPGTEVTVLSGDETRLSYAFPDSLLPGDRRTVLQHLRVRLPPPPVRQQPDTVDMVRLAPLDQTVRARLLKLTGEPAGAELQVNLQFMGASPVRPAGDTLVPVDTMPPADTVPPVDTTLARPPPDTVPGAR